MSTNKISKIIRKLREEKNLTQQALADAINVSKSSITSYELGVRQPNSKAMAKLERFFNVPGDYLRGVFLDETLQENVKLDIEKKHLKNFYSKINSTISSVSTEKQEELLSNLLCVLEIILKNSDYDIKSFLNNLINAKKEDFAELIKRSEELKKIRFYEDHFLIKDKKSDYNLDDNS